MALFSPGIFNNPIPWPISRYIDKEKTDEPGRIGDIIRTLCDDYKKEKETIIRDQNGLAVNVPLQFAKDNKRSMNITLNGERFEGRENAAKVARMLYELCGRNGGNKLMLLCAQTTGFYPISSNQDCDTKYAKLFPPNLRIFPVFGHTEGVTPKYNIKQLLIKLR